ncbi:MAG: hypothetical protein ACK4FL_02580 [Microgenomates group bacterium]
MQITISYPLSFNCLLKSGQNVDFNTFYLEKNITCDIEIPIAEKLGVKPVHIFRYLKKYVGEKIEKGEILALRKGLFTTSKIVSDNQGVIKEIDHHRGIVVISQIQEKTKAVKAFFKGEVLEVKKGSILLKVNKGEKFPVKTSTDNFGGEIFYLKDPSLALSTAHLSGKILFTESVNGYLQSKTEALGATGFVLLTKLPQATDLQFAQIKNIDDFKKILKLNFPYCLITKENSTIYFYQ